LLADIVENFVDNGGLTTAGVYVSSRFRLLVDKLFFNFSFEINGLEHTYCFFRPVSKAWQALCITVGRTSRDAAKTSSST
jgi:hypothetical protein